MVAVYVNRGEDDNRGSNTPPGVAVALVTTSGVLVTNPITGPNVACTVGVVGIAIDWVNVAPVGACFVGVSLTAEVGPVVADGGGIVGIVWCCVPALTIIS